MPRVMNSIRNLARIIKSACHIHRKNRHATESHGDYPSVDTPPAYSELFGPGEQDQAPSNSEQEYGDHSDLQNESHVPVATHIYSMSPRVAIPVRSSSVERQVVAPAYSTPHHSEGNNDESATLPVRVVSNPEPLPLRSSVPSSARPSSSTSSAATSGTESGSRSRAPIHPQQPAYRSSIPVVNRLASSQQRAVSAPQPVLTSNIPVAGRSTLNQLRVQHTLQQNRTAAQPQPPSVRSELPVHRSHSRSRSQVPPAVRAPRAINPAGSASLPRRPIIDEATRMGHGMQATAPTASSTSRQRTRNHGSSGASVSRASSSDDRPYVSDAVYALALRVARTRPSTGPPDIQNNVVDRLIANHQANHQSNSNNGGSASLRPRNRGPDRPLPLPDYIPQHQHDSQFRRTREINNFQTPIARNGAWQPDDDSYLSQRLRAHRSQQTMTRSTGMYEIRYTGGLNRSPHRLHHRLPTVDDEINNPIDPDDFEDDPYYPVNRDPGEHWESQAPANSPNTGPWRPQNMNHGSGRISSTPVKNKALGGRRKNALDTIFTKVPPTGSELDECFCLEPYSDTHHEPVNMPNFVLFVDEVSNFQAHKNSRWQLNKHRAMLEEDLTERIREENCG